MADDANIQLLLAKLPVASLARTLVECFASHPAEQAARAAQKTLAGLKEAHLKEPDSKEDTDGPAETA